MATLAQARAEEIADGLAAMAEPLDHVELRPVETGLVMIRGRVGGDGQTFNLGEATVTRAAVRMNSGEVGFAYLLGRDSDRAPRARADSGAPRGRTRAAACADGSDTG